MIKLLILLINIQEESEKVTREHVRETTYVDRDRAAAVTIGSKDLKSDMKGKRRRDFRKKRNSSNKWKQRQIELYNRYTEVKGISSVKLNYLTSNDLNF